MANSDSRPFCALLSLTSQEQRPFWSGRLSWHSPVILRKCRRVPRSVPGSWQGAGNREGCVSAMVTLCCERETTKIVQAPSLPCAPQSLVRDSGQGLSEPPQSALLPQVEKLARTARKISRSLVAATEQEGNRVASGVWGRVSNPSLRSKAPKGLASPMG